MAMNLKYKNLIQEDFEQIKSIKIQGATKVALTIGRALSHYARQGEFYCYKDFLEQLKLAGKYLLSARATEPMADNVTEFIFFRLKNDRHLTVEQGAKTVEKAVKDFEKMAQANEKHIISAGVNLIQRGDRIFTHCHSSTVVNILKSAKKKKIEVVQTETRPLLQGHKTATELVAAGIKDTLIVDSAGASLLNQRGRDKIDKIILGCDGITIDGGCVNKVGSYGLAVAAKENNIPLYIATQALKINEDVRKIQMLKIEKRDEKEVWPNAPTGLNIENPAFDRVPAELIIGYITEFGILKPSRLIKKILQHYKWLIQ
ncbi:translation initiation factor eIF-2B [Candidatus Falkowbacteria bacterium]|nr:translation initiation factor eIF-2B [Candidatus Falkowbacteria bacterium]